MWILGGVEQRDAADEGRLEACENTIVGNKAVVNQGEVVRPSQLIASVRQTIEEGSQADRRTDTGPRSQRLG
jgi:hypothetical protein